MQFFTDSNMQFPLVELSLNQGETVFIQRGSMVYHTPNVTLSTKLNASGSGLGRFVKAVGRSMVSGESSFITQVISQSNFFFSGIDTRALTKIIRNHGTMRATLTHVGDSMDHVTDQLQATVLPTDNIKQVSTKTSYPAPGVGLSVVLVDFGLKHSILRELSKRNCNVTVVPYSTTAEEILHLNPDGVMLSNGPGNPEDVPQALDMIRGVQGKIPIFGICMGHQLFAMANGAKTYKMKFGHRGFNHAVREIATGRVDFTSQNHGYAVSREDLPEHLIITHEEINDKSVEGVRHRYQPAFSVQYPPDAAPGPHDASYLFDEFIEMMEAFKQSN